MKAEMLTPYQMIPPLRATNFHNQSHFLSRARMCVQSLILHEFLILFHLVQQYYFLSRKIFLLHTLNVLGLRHYRHRILFQPLKKSYVSYTSVFYYFCSTCRKFPFIQRIQSLDIDNNCLGLIKRPYHIFT